MRARRWFEARMLERLRAEALEASWRACEVVPAQLGDSIGDVAALTVAWNGLEG